MAPLLDNLRTAVKASSWSQAEIAQALGLSAPHVCQFLAGTKGLSIEKAEELADLLKLEIITRPKDKAKAKRKKRGK